MNDHGEATSNALADFIAGLQARIKDLEAEVRHLKEGRAELTADWERLRREVRSDDRFFAGLPEHAPADWRRLAMAVRKRQIYADKRRDALRDAQVAEIDEAIAAYERQMDESLRAMLGEVP